MPEIVLTAKQIHNLRNFARITAEGWDVKYTISQNEFGACAFMTNKPQEGVWPLSGYDVIKEEKSCQGCKLAYPLEYISGYGWYHKREYGPDFECTNPEVQATPPPEY